MDEEVKTSSVSCWNSASRAPVYASGSVD